MSGSTLQRRPTHVKRRLARYDSGTMAHETIDWLYGLQHFGIKLGLDNIRALLDLLDHPESGYRCVHIAGTNGKGSVAAMTDAMLTSSGVRSGLFTSPHLVRPNERIRIAGIDIEDRELHRLLRNMRRIIEKALSEGKLETQPSFFEVITATALQVFAERAVEAAVLEVGLGGRLDATNAVDADVCVVVSIGFDHVKTLGPTLERIAGEKAGIIKPGAPVVCGVIQQRALDVLERTCRSKGSELIDARSAVRLISEDLGRYTLAGSARIYPDLLCALPGRHQIDNSRVALAAFELLMERMGLTPKADAVAAGLASVRWPGRLEWIEPRNGMPRLLLDGAHNPAGIAAVTHFLRSGKLPPPVLLCGATSGKPLDKLLGPLAGLVDGVVITRPPVDRGLDPDDVAKEVEGLFGRIETASKPADALRIAARLAGEERYVLVTGSLYLVGEVLGLLAAEDVPGPVAM
jgi:dihydrofolate synthase/folylpolyglutamate synthase